MLNGIVSGETAEMYQYRKIAANFAVIASVILLSSCDLRATPPSCNDYFEIGDRSDFLTDERGIARKRDSDVLWYRCPAGKAFTSRRCEGPGIRLGWHDAMAYAEEFALKSGKPWRIPKVLIIHARNACSSIFVKFAFFHIHYIA